MKVATWIMSIIAASLSLSVIAAEPVDTQQSRLTHVQQRWAEVNYTLQDKAQEQAFEQLLGEVKLWVAEQPKHAEALIWQGIVQSTYAGVAGGLTALGLAKDARASLEQALAINPAALDGSAYASLGTLYFKVPGWPLGFGDDDKAKELLEKALALNPDGIDSNYFYADYLYDQGRYRQALAYTDKALAAAPRAGRELADTERRKEIALLRERIRKKIR